jgi:hybrid polyketide synthase/nonribosomal peptide synthetase ACE1
MQPSVIVALDAFPTNYSQKIDRSAVASIPVLQGQQARLAAPPTSVRTKQSSESRLKDLWRQVLGTEVVSQYHIDSESSFFHIGGSSSGLIGLQSLIRSTFGVEVALVRLFEYPTLSAMGRCIDPTAIDRIIPKQVSPVPTPAVEPPRLKHPSAAPIDWDLETAIPRDLYELEVNSPKEVTIPFKTVVITGSTGFLGKELLLQMVADETIKKIYAVAVRKAISDLPSIFSDPKVEVHSGHLAAPRLGLSERTAKEIFSIADSVIHNGSDVSFLKTYQTLEKSNMQSTGELVKLCLPYQVSMHFISSSRVAHLSNKDIVGEESLSIFKTPTDGSDGYTATKWASERFLERVGEKFSMPIYVHRPSSINGDNAPVMDLMTNLLTYSKKIRKTPKSSMWQGVLDFVSVGHVARGVLTEVRSESILPAGMVKYLHQSGDVEIPIEGMQVFLEKETGQNFGTLSVESWVREATKAGMNELIGAYLMNAAELPIKFRRLSKAHRLNKFEDCTQAEEASSWFSLRFW